MENKVCVRCGMKYPNHKMSCKIPVKEWRLPTAEEFLINKGFPVHAEHGLARSWMIEFAKMHVEAALKEADEKATVTPIDHEEISKGSFRPIWGVNSESILNSYPPDLIK